MNRQDININDYKYIVDLYKANIDIKHNVYKKFIMFKRSDIINSISCDTDIYFIERDLFIEEYTKMLKGEDIDNMIFENIVFPITEYTNVNKSFSASIKDFNTTYKCKNTNYLNALNYEYLEDDESERLEYLDNAAKTDAEEFIKKYGFELYDYNKAPTTVLCDMIRIYHPSIVRTIKYIVYINNYINNIHFHYYCKIDNSHINKTNNTFEISNFKYSEFYELYIPNIEYLFNLNNNGIGKDNLYYKENINLVSEVDSNILSLPIINIEQTKDNNYKLILGDFINLVNYIYEKNEMPKIKSILDITEFSKELWQDCKFIFNYDIYEKPIYEIKDININENYIILNNNTEEYIDILDDIPSAINLYNEKSYIEHKNYISLKTLLEPFEIVEVKVNKQKWAFDDEENDKPYTSSFQKKYVSIRKSIENNYLTFPINILLYPYSEIDRMNSYVPINYMAANGDTYVSECKFKLSVKMGFDENNGIISIIGNFDYPNKDKFIEQYEERALDEAYKLYNNVKFYDYKYAKINYTDIYDLENENEENCLDIIGYRIQIASDFNFKNIIYTLNINDTINYETQTIIDDFAFNLNSLFNSWDDLPDVMFISCSFIDRYLGIQLLSNRITMTKEWYKYLINDTSDYYIDFNKINTEDMNIAQGINFINNINCNIIKKSEETNNENVNLGNNVYNVKPKLIYKPIFYKTQPLQNIKIKDGIPQNIGINLNNYLSKVPTFKILIGEHVYVETGRNDMYVIFNINPSELAGISGTYVITNQDDEYISDGNWSLY